MGCGCNDKDLAEIAMASALMTLEDEMGLTAEQMDKLRERAKVSIQVARALARRERHTARIHTLERVLDPADLTAVGNPTSGNEESYRMEIARRQGDLAQIDRFLTETLAALEA